MKLHEAIEKLLIEAGRPLNTADIASALNKKKWYSKKDGSDISPFQIAGRVKNYPLLFDRKGSLVSLSRKMQKIPKKPFVEKPKKVRDKDEKYVLDLCDRILGFKSKRQHKFDFLLGDPNKQGKAAKLPVDAYYEDFRLVIEYREKQHSEAVAFFDKKDTLTLSGVDRGEQRKIYDERRRKVLPLNGILLIEISYSDFKHDKAKRILRDDELDHKIVAEKLKKFVKFHP